jgi:hypothetical protein
MRAGLRAVLQGGLLAGALDILAAFLVYGLRGATPVRILQSIASGLLGAEAFEGGLATAALGGLLHFFIASGWAVVYYGASRRLAVLLHRPVLSGMAYGAAVYLIMNLVVLPLSAVPKRPFAFDVVILIVHMFCVGLPIALSVSRSAPKA